MELQHELLLLRHRREIAAEAVDHHDSRVVPLDVETEHVGELAGRELGWIDLAQDDAIASR